MDKPRIGWFIVLFLGASLFPGACSDTASPLNCTDAGCSSGLRVELLGTLPAEYRITFEVPGGNEFFVDCNAESPCYSGVFLGDFFPETVRVTVTAGEETWSTLATPEWEEIQPNGPRCSPTCRAAEISLQVGA